MTDADFTSWYEGYRGRYRYDLVDGFAHVFDMAGATPMHGRLVGEIATRLRPHVLARGCDVITNDIAVSPRPGTIYYPDIAVTCDDADLAVVDTTPWKHPSLIVEVASRSTQSNDLDAKARAYLAMGAEYVIFSSLARKVLLDGRVARERLAGAPLLIRTFGVELDVDGIYDAVRMPRALPAS